MSNLYSFNFIKIDISLFNSVGDVLQFLNSNNIPKKEISPQKLIEAKLFHNVLFFDPITFNLVAYIKKGENNINFVPELFEMMNGISSQKKDKKPKKLSLDGILDKINTQGIKSLNKNELDFLSNSQ